MKYFSYIKKANWILLGLIMLIPGVIKLFFLGPDRVTAMLTGLGLPFPIMFTWILIIAEIGSGIAILTKWKLKYIITLPIVIILVATFTAQFGDWINMAIHLLVVTNYLMLLEE